VSILDELYKEALKRAGSPSAPQLYILSLEEATLAIKEYNFMAHRMFTMDVAFSNETLLERAERTSLPFVRLHSFWPFSFYALTSDVLKLRDLCQRPR
jgi:hypothetical protein